MLKTVDGAAHGLGRQPKTPYCTGAAMCHLQVRTCLCGAMANYFDDRAGELSDLEAYTLLRNLLCECLPGGATNPHGAQFRTSLKYFRDKCAEVGYKSGWIMPPDKHRLPVDDVIRNLLEKNSAPHLDANRSGSLLSMRMYGPYDLVRSHLEHIASSFPNFEEEAQALNAVAERSAIFKEAFDSLIRAADIPFWEVGRRPSQAERWSSEGEWHAKLTSIQEEVLSHQRKIIDAAESVGRLLEINSSDLDHIWKNDARTGRKRQLWKQCFVRSIAQTWTTLTGSKPSVSADSPFATFVRECWNSYDENMPQVSFDRAVRNVR